jgi:hypothetical protein
MMLGCWDGKSATPRRSRLTSWPWRPEDARARLSSLCNRNLLRLHAPGMQRVFPGVNLGHPFGVEAEEVGKLSADDLERVPVLHIGDGEPNTCRFG